MLLIQEKTKFALRKSETAIFHKNDERFVHVKYILSIRAE